MEGSVYLLQILTIDVGVDLRRRYVCVTEHFLHRSKIGSALEQMRRKGVAHGMRTDGLPDPSGEHMLS